MNENELDKLLDELAEEPDKLRRTLKTVAILTELLAPVKPVVVGGAALEFYTLGGYATRDVDLVVVNRKLLDAALNKLGFQRTTGRHWYSERLDMAIEAPGEVLAGSEDKITTATVDNRKVYIIGVEDLIVDRLAAAKFWQGCEEDFNLSVRLLILHGRNIDYGYLEEAAQKEQVEDILERATRESRVRLNRLRSRVSPSKKEEGQEHGQGS